MSVDERNKLLADLLGDRQAAAPAPAAGLGFGRRKPQNEPPRPLGVLVPITVQAPDGGDCTVHLHFGPEAADPDVLDAILDQLGPELKTWKKAAPPSRPPSRPSSDRSSYNRGSNYNDRDDRRSGGSGYGRR